MVGDLKPRRLRAAALGLIAVLLAATAPAQEALPDPTRAPAGYQGPGAAAAPTASAALVLQSVLMGSGRAPAAVISGQLVALGGQVGGMRLARVSERSVLLHGPLGPTTLTLMPDVHKQARTRRMEPRP